jgi:molybdopterin synthase catalytic subunit
MEGKYDVGATFSDGVVPNASRVTGCVGALGKRVDTLKVVAMSSEVPNDVLVSAPKFPQGKVDAIVAAAKAASTSNGLSAHARRHSREGVHSARGEPGEVVMAHPKSTDLEQAFKGGQKSLRADFRRRATEFLERRLTASLRDDEKGLKPTSLLRGHDTAQVHPKTRLGAFPDSRDEARERCHAREQHPPLRQMRRREVEQDAGPLGAAPGAGVEPPCKAEYFAGLGELSIAEPISNLDRMVPADLVSVARETGGDHVQLFGQVRDDASQKVTRLDYEAYGPMAQKKLAQIGAEAREKWPGTQVAVLHRVGTLVPGELAVVIAVSAAHRKEAFRACEYVIDRLKEDVPIWKKEYAEDGQVWVGIGP